MYVQYWPKTQQNQRKMKGIGIATAMLLLVFEGYAQEQDTGCVNRLIPCLSYLNGTRTREVPESCCNPLRWVIESNPDCLCSLMSKEGSNRAEQAGIDVNKAQQLPGRCGQHVNPLSCLSGSSDGVSNFAAPTTLQLTIMLIISTIFQFLWASNSPLNISI